jgi:hypothetical protein
VSAQQINSYACDFEDEAENALWTINSRPDGTLKNQWYIGAAGAFGVNSTKGLYISGGTGEEAEKNIYVNALGLNPTSGEAIQGEFIASYRQLNLADGTYNLVFDWQTMGRVDDKLYVTWVNEGDVPYIIPGIPVLGRDIKSLSDAADVPTYCANSPAYRGSSAWRSVATTITVSGGAGGRLVVAWYVKAGVNPANPAPAVDNIYIYQGPCSAPTNVNYDGNTSSLTWNGSAASYDVIMHNFNTNTISTFGDITTNSLQLSEMAEEGMYYFYVRSSCDEVRHSPWVFVSKFVWISGARCIDIFDLTPDNSGAAKCFWTDTESGDNYDPYMHDHAGQVDFGYDNQNSRHTIHFIPGETDPRTGNGLKTIPEGEIASIRVNGFWETAGTHASCIEYDYPVQSGVSDLLVLKYAVVLENPDHPEEAQPRFKLEIMQGNTVIDPCAQCDFKAGYGDASSWHKYYVPDASGNPTNTVYDWCDWDSVTISLRNYIGRTLKIRLSAYDCTYSGHFGYAYFTLNCKGGDLQGISCGDYSTDHFDAPEGFDYRWYLAREKDNPNKRIFSDEASFGISPSDTAVYLVDLITRNKPDCYYTLEANPNPRFPRAVALHSTSARNCQYTASFTSRSKIVYINRISGEEKDSDQPIQRVYWNFGDGTPEMEDPGTTFTHNFPGDGGEYEVLCIASMSDGICVDTLRIPLSLQDLHSDNTSDTTHICGEGTDSEEVRTLVNQYGCEYTHTHYTLYHMPYDTLYEERMCEGGRYFFPANGRYYTASIDTTLNLKTPYNCDSTISLHLVVDPKLIVEYSKDVNVCLDKAEIEIPYVVTSGMMDSIKVYFSDAARLWGFDSCYGFKNGEEIRIPIPNSDIRPDNYQLDIEFGGERCHMDLQHATLHVQYKSSIVMQTGGFIALYNSAYNGGFNFAAYEWYKDGVLIESNNAYVPASEFDINSVYTVRLRRSGESNFIESCPIIYNPATALDDAEADVLVYPTFVDKGGSLTVSAGSGFSIFSVLGTLVARYERADYVRHIPAPVAGGVYIILFDNKQTVQIVVR